MAFLRSLTVLAFVLSPSAALADVPADASALDVKVTPGDGAAMKADANLQGHYQQIETGLHVALEADPGALSTDPLVHPSQNGLSRESMDVKTVWFLQPRVRIEMTAGDNFGQTWATLSPFLASGHQTSSDSRAASAGLILEPLNAVDVSLVGAAMQTSVLDIVVGQNSAPAAPTRFDTTTQSATAGLKWRLFSWFNLIAKGRLETSNVTWRGAPASDPSSTDAAATLSYTYFEPSVTGQLTAPWNSKLGLTFERAVSPIDPQTFSAFASVDNGSSEARFAPNREWRYHVDYDQTLLGEVQLHAILTEARIESATELGPVAGDRQAPVSVVGGERQQFDARLSAPLSVFGLPSLTLQGAGVWRNSQVRDPFTGEWRRASAETAQVATLGLVQSLAEHRARWGIEGHFGGDQSLYQMSEVTRVTVADSIGGFVEYGPGPFLLRLQIDGLYGGDRDYTDMFYEGARPAGYLDHVDHHNESGQAIRLTLRKPL